MDPISAAKFFLDFAKSIVGLYAGLRKEQKEREDEIADYLTKISSALVEYADSLSNSENLGRGHQIKNRYYLESSLSNLAWIIGKGGEEHAASAAVDRLKSIKVHDGMLVPEVSEMLEGGQDLPTSERKRLIEEMHRAAGEFAAAADIIRTRKNG